MKLKYLPELGTITESASTDYRYRAKAKRSDVMAALVKAVGDIDYSNFKDEVAKVQGKSRAHVYGEIWHTLHKLQTTLPTPKQSGKTGNAAAFGGVLVDAQGRVLLFEPKNHFDGYHWTFPKGRPESGETPRETALREVLEETGYAAEVVAEIPGSFAGGTTENQYFLMRPLEPPGRPNKSETSNLKWASPDDAKVLIAQTTNDKGRKRDLAVLAASMAAKASTWCSRSARRPILAAALVGRPDQDALSPWCRRWQRALHRLANAQMANVAALQRAWPCRAD